MRAGWSEGRVFQRGNVWWISYYYNGKEIRESGGKTERLAKAKLKDRIKQIRGDRFVGPEQERLSVGELLDGLVTHLTIKGAKGMVPLRSHLRPGREFFAMTRAVDVTTALVERFTAERLAVGKAPATVNREVGALKQALNLARRQGRLSRVPYIPMLTEQNARAGFFEHAELEAVVGNLPAPIDDLTRFAYWCGWRRGELVELRWDAVDRAAREVRLRTSKNGRGRVLPLDGPLWDIIERRWVAREVQVAEGVTRLAEFVFHRTGNRVGEFRKSWAAACREAGVPGKLFHDLRRTAARNMVRAGVPETVAMSITGHRTRSMFDRYNITDGEDQRAALRQMEQHLGSVSASRATVVVMKPRAEAG